MNGRESKVGAPSTDLLVCFPSRSQLALIPKPIYSPTRSNEPAKRHHHHHYHYMKKTTGGGRGGPLPGASPLLWAKPSKQMGCGASGPDHISEPTSPKVTCAGQIKERPSSRASACRNWQSVMEEIERIHSNRKQQRKRNRAESFGFKKDITQFMTCIRSIRLDFKCFGSFPGQDTTSDEEDEEGEDENHAWSNNYHETPVVGGNEEEGSRTVLSKWFVVVQENQAGGLVFGKGEEEKKRRMGFDDSTREEVAVPQPNAMLLMRCRSAPVQSGLEEKEKEEEERQNEQVEEEGKEKEEVEEGPNVKKKKRETLAVVMKQDPDFNNLSLDIAKETWLVGGLMDPLSRSKSWKR